MNACEWGHMCPNPFGDQRLMLELSDITLYLVHEGRVVTSNPELAHLSSLANQLALGILCSHLRDRVRDRLACLPGINIYFILFNSFCFMSVSFKCGGPRTTWESHC